MARLRSRLAALAVSVVALGAIAAPAAQAQTISLTNWQVSGSLGIKKLNQDIPLPAGSTFNGSVNLDQGHDHRGHDGARFHRNRDGAGYSAAHRPFDQGGRLAERHVHPQSDGTATVNVDVAQDIRIKRIRIGLLSLPAGFNCHTSSPVVLPLHATAPLGTALSQGLSFSGTYNLPPLTGCGLLTPTLNLLMSGPNNPFNVSIKPPA
jgi:hypothetical protein